MTPKYYTVQLGSASTDFYFFFTMHFPIPVYLTTMQPKLQDETHKPSSRRSYLWVLGKEFLAGWAQWFSLLPYNWNYTIVGLKPVSKTGILSLEFYRTFLEPSWNLSVTFLQPFYNLSATFLQPFCNLFANFLQPFCNLSATKITRRDS